MKDFPKRAGMKIARFFWSWGFLKFILWTVTLAILLYVEEDWRGARVWAKTKAAWEAKGETFDINHLAPRPVPDDQNLAALPLFKMEPDPSEQGSLAPLTMRRLLHLPDDITLPHGADWHTGKLADVEKNRNIVAEFYAKTFKKAPPANDALAQFDELYPVLNDLRDAAAARPSCRFEQDYRYVAPEELVFTIIIAQIKLAQFVNTHAVLALDAKKPDIALGDIKTNLKLAAGLRAQPFLVSGLVAIGVMAINFSSVYEGLATHAWNDAQLDDLQNQLADIDFLADYQHAFRGEACISTTGMELLKHNRPALVSELHPQVQDDPPSPPQRKDYTPFFWPDGWLDLLKARAANFDLTVVGFADVQRHIFVPDKINLFIAEIEDNRRRIRDPYSLWGILSGVAIGPVTNSAQKFAFEQVLVDEARMACGLERYRLAHGAYPASLEALVPACIDELPHDVMNGAPYHYQVRPDGTYLLYSVGWNQTDDGGKMVNKKDSPAQDYSEGDWPWVTPQVQKTQ